MTIPTEDELKELANIPVPEKPSVQEQGSKSEAKTLRLGRLRLEKSFFAKVREVKAGKNFLAKVRLG